MTAQQFFALSTAEKETFLASIEHISERYEPDYTVMLYYIGGLYIEAFYHRRAGIIQYECLSNLQSLKPYLPLPEAIIKTPKPSYLKPAIDQLVAMAAQQQTTWMHRFNDLMQQKLGYLFTNRTVAH